MELNIDPTLSVFHLTERVQKRSAVLNHRRTMNIISYEIENATLRDGAHTRIFSSFQYMSRFLPQVSRYRKLAENAERIYVFGIPDMDVPPIDNVTYVPLTADDQLAREWFIVSYGRDFATMLSTEEISRFGDPDAERVFKGLWTFETGLTSIVAEWLTRVVNAPALDVTDADMDANAQYGHIEHIKSRLEKRLAAQAASDGEGQTYDELRRMMQTALPHAQMSSSVSSHPQHKPATPQEQPSAVD